MPPSSDPADIFTIGIIQDHADDDASLNLTRAVALIRQAAASGAQIICLKENHQRSMDNLHRLQLASDQREPFRIVTLPFPRPVTMAGERLPASYANFYIANGVVIVPTFNAPNDRVALDTLAKLMPSRTIIGIHAVDLVWGLGTLHCLTQQEPAAANQQQVAVAS